VIAMEVSPAVDPVPVRLAVCGLLPALSAMVRAPVRLPTRVGVNVTLIVHFAWAATEAPQVLVSAKSPVTETLVIASAVAWLLVSVTTLAPLVVPTVRLGNVSAVGERVTAAVAAAGHSRNAGPAQASTAQDARDNNQRKSFGRARIEGLTTIECVFRGLKLR
jgi:hypothetical protein